MGSVLSSSSLSDALSSWDGMFQSWKTSASRSCTVTMVEHLKNVAREPADLVSLTLDLYVLEYLSERISHRMARGRKLTRDASIRHFWRAGGREIRDGEEGARDTSSY